MNSILEELEKKWDILLAIILTSLTLFFGGTISSGLFFQVFIAVPIGVAAILGVFLTFSHRFLKAAFSKPSYKKDLTLAFLTPIISSTLAYILSFISVLFAKNYVYLSYALYYIAIFFFFFMATSLIFLIKYLYDTAAIVYASDLDK